MNHKTITLICKQCGEEYQCPSHRKDVSKYCSVKCQHASMRDYVNRICTYCGKDFVVPAYRIKDGGGVHCSLACRIQSNKKMAKANSITIKCLFCGSEYTMNRRESNNSGGRKFCSRDCFHKYRRLNSKDDADRRMNAKKIYHWRRAVLKKYNNSCIICGRSDGTLVAHHIIPYSIDLSLRFEVDNGVCLCPKCHDKEHERLAKLCREQRDIFIVKWYRKSNGESYEQP